MKWLIAAAVGIIMGFIASIVDWLIRALDSLRINSSHYLLTHRAGRCAKSSTALSYAARGLRPP